jgi:hypothetical protein
MILPLIKEKAKRPEAEENLIVKRRDELAVQLQRRPKAINALIALEHMKDFTRVMADFLHLSQQFELFLFSPEGLVKSPHQQRRLLCTTSSRTVAKFWTISALWLACLRNAALATSSTAPRTKTRKGGTSLQGKPSQRWGSMAWG